MDYSDGYCDAENNNEKCQFDGGDCCLDNVNKTRCKYCICVNQNSHNFCQFMRLYAKEEFGNRICSGLLNTPGCNYDLGDCCGERRFNFEADCSLVENYVEESKRQNFTCDCQDPSSPNYSKLGMGITDTSASTTILRTEKENF